MSAPPKRPTAPAVGRGRLPAPAAVVVATLQALREREGITSTDDAAHGNTNHDNNRNRNRVSREDGGLPDGGIVDSASDAFIPVEVETTQGYVYAGKLVDIDGDYNVTLREAAVRRERPCDVARAVRQQRRRTLLAQLGALAPPELLNSSGGDGGDVEERAGAPTRPRFIGTVLIRSSNLMLIRFPPPPAAAAVMEEQGSGAGKGGGLRKGGRSLAEMKDMKAAFRLAAVSVKRAIAAERKMNRDARRKRLTDAKKQRTDG